MTKKTIIISLLVVLPFIYIFSLFSTNNKQSGVKVYTSTNIGKNIIIPILGKNIKPIKFTLYTLWDGQIAFCKFKSNHLVSQKIKLMTIEDSGLTKNEILTTFGINKLMPKWFKHDITKASDFKFHFGESYNIIFIPKKNLFYFQIYPKPNN